MHQAIQHGNPHTAMAAWGRILGEPQIRDVASYVRSLEQPRPAGMTQADFDAEVGGQIYRSYCGICHGRDGSAETTIGRALTDHPRDFQDTQAMARLSDDDMARAIEYGKPGTAMVAWRSILSPKDINRIVLFIRRQIEPPR
jgi:mono/diheme cytochrome c family protein